jgi:hypothetical protein
MLMSATVGRRGNMVDHIVFWAINIGITGFAVGLLFDVTAMKRIFTPIMGIGLFLGLAVYALRLLEIRVSGMTEPAAASERGR